MQRLLATILGVSVFSVIGLVASVAAEGTSVPEDAPTEDSLRIAFGDEHGGKQVTPYFAVNGAYPGMAPELAVVTLHNSGTLDVGYDVSVVVPAKSADTQLADVLQVTVTGRDTDEMMYRGPLSGVRFDGTAVLPAGASDSYLMAIEWPDGGKSDNAFQGTALEFELRARARDAG